MYCNMREAKNTRKKTEGKSEGLTTHAPTHFCSASSSSLLVVQARDGHAAAQQQLASTEQREKDLLVQLKAADKRADDNAGAKYKLEEKNIKSTAQSREQTRRRQCGCQRKQSVVQIVMRLAFAPSFQRISVSTRVGR